MDPQSRPRDPITTPRVELRLESYKFRTRDAINRFRRVVTGPFWRPIGVIMIRYVLAQAAHKAMCTHDEHSVRSQGNPSAEVAASCAIRQFLARNWRGRLHGAFEGIAWLRSDARKATNVSGELDRYAACSNAASRAARFTISSVASLCFRAKLTKSARSARRLIRLGSPEDSK